MAEGFRNLVYGVLYCTRLGVDKHEGFSGPGPLDRKISAAGRANEVNE